MRGIKIGGKKSSVLGHGLALELRLDLLQLRLGVPELRLEAFGGGAGRHGRLPLLARPAAALGRLAL